MCSWCEQDFCLPAEQTASGWPRAAPGQPVVCCTSPVHSQVLTALPQPPAEPGQLVTARHTDCALAKASSGVPGWMLGLVAQLRSGHITGSSKLVPGEGGYSCLSCGVWEQGCTVS